MDTTSSVANEKESMMINKNDINNPLLEEPNAVTSDTNASVGGSIINMTNNVMGSGLVALAFSMKQCSLIPGILLLIILAVIACLSQIIITRSCRITDKYTYKEMGTSIFGKAGGIIISTIMLLYSCGACISYFIIIGDIFLDIFAFILPGVLLLQNRAFVIGFVCLFFVFPLCMMKTIDSLKYISLFSIISTFITVGVVFGQFVLKPIVSDTVIILEISGELFRVIPLICVAFNCHYNVPRYYYELKGRSPGRMWMTSIGVTSVTLFVYFIIALSGYLMFGDNTKGNILCNFSSDTVAPTIARVGLGLGIICHVPIVYFAVRTNLHSLFCSLKEFHGLWLRYLTTGCVLLSTVTIAILQTKVEDVIALNGSLFGSLIMFAIPGIMYLLASEKEEGVKMKRIQAWFLLIFGVIVCIVGTYLNAVNSINDM